MVSPAPEQVAELAKISSFLEAHSTRRGGSPTPAVYLSGANEHDRVELSEPLFGLLTDVVDALNRGQSVSIVARDREIRTQQAAEILGISRPTDVGLINKGDLAATVPGALRRKLRLADVVTVQRALGHSTPSIALNVYSHLWPSAEDKTRAATAGFMAEIGDIATGASRRPTGSVER